MALSQRQRFIAKTTTSYLLFGCGWIFLSDRLLLAFTDIEALTRLSTAKGITFILLTGLLLLLALTAIPDRNETFDATRLHSRDLFLASSQVPRWVAYLFALATTLAMLGLHLQLAEPSGESPLLILFVLPIILSSVLGGLGPGVLATAIAAAGVVYYHTPLLQSLEITATHDLFQWCMLIATGLLSSYLSELLHRARRQAEALHVLQQKAKEDLQRSEERFQLAMRGTDDGLWDWDLQSGELYLSPRWKAMLGYEEHELSHHLDTWKTLVHPDDRQRTLDLVDELLAGHSERFETEFRMRHKDGSYREILSRAFPVRDASGQPTRMVGTHIDMTERHQNVRKIAEQASLLENTSRMAKVGGWRFDVADGSGSWTPEVARIHDVDPQFVTSREIGLSFYHGPYRQAIESAITRAIEFAEPYDLELEMISKRGIAKWVRTVGRPILKNGRVTHLEGILLDISERKKAEQKIRDLNAQLEQRVQQRTAELLAANAELESFSYAVSHDLRAPLRAMTGFSKALIEDYGDQLTGEAKTYLNQIILGSAKMGQLIDGLLTLARSTRHPLHFQRIEIFPLVERIIGDLRREEPDRIVDCFVEPHLWVWSDAAMLEVVFRNLLDNAWKYTAQTPAAAIDLFSCEQDGKRWFCVSDNGAGFPQEHSDKLFQPFHRLHRQDEFPGLGIGLATVHRVIRRQGGSITARGEVGQGTCLCCYFPDYYAEA